MLAAACRRAGLALDRREVLGLQVWIKPIKLELSAIVFLPTMAVRLFELGRGGDFVQSRL